VSAAGPDTGREGRRLRICGTVQGVGFRPWVHRVAAEEGLTGSVHNDAAGVVVEVFGPRAAVERVRSRLECERPAAARVREIREECIPGPGPRSFSILASEGDAERRVSIPPDLGLCDACLRELRDPADRRHRYPFTNCTDCGPRFSIATDVPYDRHTTTMSAFPMCAACRREYEDPADRRFHAEPIACPACGPKVAWLDADGGPIEVEDPIDAAARALCDGSIVAVRGLGGFNLVCDATASEVVKRLRERKRRPAKPFAVMVADLDAAHRLARVGDAEARLLESPESPIVLLAARPDAEPLAPEVAPGLSLVGVMLAYTPLHQLLLAAVGRPLVMTSGNLADEPIAVANAEALVRLRGIADAFLVHDREIANRCDDSIARVICGAPAVLRRARGWVPRPIPVPVPFPEPVLACGAQQRNAVCLGVGDLAFPGPHVGDLETPEAFDAFCEGIERLERFVGVRAEVLACDLHPDYLSTRYAQERPARRRIAVQHHHAHVASALAEHGSRAPILGLAWDGTGFAPDGSAWGGELLRVDAAACERLGTFRPVALAGGERAIREPWRVALALLVDAFDADPPLSGIALFERVGRARVAAVRSLLDERVHTVPAHGVGRLFDGIGALALGMPCARYEGEVALAWNLAADPCERRPYPIALIEATHPIALGEAHAPPLEVDLRPMVRAVVADLARGVAAATIAGRFHETLAFAAEVLAGRVAKERGEGLPVALTGGCFQNALLAERVRDRLRARHRVLLHREIPPGDGGIALGQAVVAAARLAADSGEDAACV
jgi:hydrogenase maturation protein HypF